MSDWKKSEKILYNSVNFKYTGFTNCWNIFVEDNETLPSKALAFKLIGLEKQIKYPIGYFSHDKCDADIQTSIVQFLSNLDAYNGLPE